MAAVPKSFANGVKRMCSVLAAAEYKVPAITIASEVAGPPTTPAVVEVLTNWLAAWP